MFAEEVRYVKKKLARVLGLGAGAAIGLPMFLLAPGQAGRRQKRPFMGVNFAHRGLHARDKSVPENSLAAFRLAVRAGYGVELDVQLSKDGQVVVFHDDTLDRVCGVTGRVDERTYEGLLKLRLCGTQYRIPLLQEVLDTVRGAGPMIVELKTGRHNKELCEKTYALLKNYRGEVCIESFDPFIVMWFRFHAPEVFRGQLAMPREGYKGMSKLLGFAGSRTLFNFLARPQFIAYKIGPRPLTVRLAEFLGAMKIGWTSHEPRNEKGRDAVIFEYYKPRAKYK